MNNCTMLDFEYVEAIEEPKRLIQTVDFTIEDLTSISPIPNLGLSGIVERTCYKPRDGVPYMLFFCEAEKRYNGGCPFCGSLGYHVHGKLRDDKLIHDVPRGVIQVDIRLELKRYRCNDCGATFSHPYEEIVEGKQMTKRLYDLIRRESFRRPFADVGKDYGYSPTTIANIFDEYSAELEANRPHIVAPRVLGIDEKHIVHAMRGVFVNIETGQLLEMTSDNKRRDILGTIEKMKDYDKNIQIVTMDMANGYRSYIYEALPYAKIIVDKFHVIQDLYTKVKTTKTAVMQYLKESIDHMPDLEETKAEKEATYRLLTKNPWLFKFGEDKLSKRPSRLILMADVCTKFPELNHLRLLKEGLERIYKATTRTDAQSLYAEWLKLVPPKSPKQEAAWEATYGVKAELFKDFKALRNATKSWEQEIFNYFDEGCQFTNAASEGTNNLIGRMNQAGNGYGFKRLRAKAVFYHEVIPSTVYTSKTIRKEVKSRPSVFDNGNGSIGYMTFQSFNPQFTDEIAFSSYRDNAHAHPLSVFEPFPSDYFEGELP